MNRTVKATHSQGTGTSPRPSERDSVKTRSRFSSNFRRTHTHAPSSVQSTGWTATRAPGVSIASCRQRPDDRQRVRETADRFFGSRHAHRHRGRAFEKRHRPRRLTAPFEVHGNRRAHFVQSIGEKKLHSLRDPPMDEPAPRRSDRRVGDLANAIVAEIPSLVRLNADDVAAPELVERAHERVLFEVACLGQEVEPESRGRRPRRLPRLPARRPRGAPGAPRRRTALRGSMRSPGESVCPASSIRPRSTMNSGCPSVSRKVRASAASSSVMLGDLAGELRGGRLVERAERDRRHEVIASR